MQFWLRGPAIPPGPPLAGSEVASSVSACAATACRYNCYRLARYRRYRLPQALPAAGTTLPPFIIRYSLQDAHGAQALRFAAVANMTPLGGVCARWPATLRSQRTTAPTPLRLCVVPLLLYR